ncbi:ubiquitin domain-containing protein UBFD1 isoform X1 [Rattus norvegicus]|uniref:Ubiquitin family domain containing 1 n=1 Tax=Rattus norvegicus TaxID=10116 RepID=G3V8E4_RAT|nr:ubiquitin domain-containing protein UBFD1 isoform X1 [Rattus norvegicus]|eukprot:XP_006230251.1 PREDICTED: ubiquitin domain-containing protein UBFD1 isoform X1 [Rattus norvegicus]
MLKRGRGRPGKRRRRVSIETSTCFRPACVKLGAVAGANLSQLASSRRPLRARWVVYTIIMAAAGAPDGMEEPSMDTEAEAVATEAPARPLNCVEAEAVVGTAAEDSCDARGNLQPAPAQPPGDPAAQASVSNGEDAGGGAGRELVDLKIIWNKTKHDVKVPLDSTGSELKQKIHSITGLPPAMQKVMYKGLVPEDKTLREIKVTSGAKIMVVGSTINDVLAVNTPKDAAQQDAKAEESKKEPLCRQKQHRKVLDKGKPEDVMPSVKGAQERLPTVPLSGMYNKSGGKVRLTFKLEQDQLWIGTKDSWRDPNMPNSPVSGQHCRYSVFESGLRNCPWAPLKMLSVNLLKDMKTTT